MKHILLWGLVMMGGVVPAFATGSWNFYSSLPVPVASFAKVETKDCEPTAPTTGEFNIGSEASTAGDINIQGPAIDVGNLYMEDRTIVKGNKRWIADEIKIGFNGNVTVNNMLGGTFTLPLSSNEDVEVEDTLQVDQNAFVRGGCASGTLWQKEQNFKFQSNGDEPKRDATFQQIGPNVWAIRTN